MTSWSDRFCRCSTARPTANTEVMRSAIALNGSFFNTQRMVQQYLANAYMLREVAPSMPRAKPSVPALAPEV